MRSEICRARRRRDNPHTSANPAVARSNALNSLRISANGKSRLGLEAFGVVVVGLLVVLDLLLDTVQKVSPEGADRIRVPVVLDARNDGVQDLSMLRLGEEKRLACRAIWRGM